MQQQNKEITYKNGRYQRYELLGQGTCGDVYRGYDTQKKMDVAIKIQQTIDAGELTLMKQFNEHTKTLGLRNVVNVYEVIEEPKQIILIMDYAKGGDLYHYQQSIPKQHQVPNKDIMLQLANGLRELHQLYYVHRDMKPENILVCYGEDKNNLFKIADFGLSKKANNAQTTRIGTPYYMAPELINQSNQKYGFEVDIWALGCIYYEIITGNSLFQGNSVQDLMQKVKEVKQPWIDNQIDQLSKYNIIERERKLIKLMISIETQRRPKILEVVQTLTGSDEFINKPQIIVQPNKNIQIPYQYQNINRNPNQPIYLQKDYPLIHPYNPTPVINLQHLEQQQTNSENKIKKEYEDRLKIQEENLKRQLQQDLIKKKEELEKEFQQKQFKNNEEREKQEQILKQQNQQLQEESDKKLKDQQEQSKKQMQEEMDRQINESKSNYENQKKQLESQIRKFQQTLNKQIDSYKQEYNQFANQIQEVEKQLNEFHIKNSKIQEEYGKIKEYFETKQKDVNNMSQSQDSTQISQNIEAIKKYNKQLNEFIQNIKLKIQQEQSENELKQQLIIKQEQIQKKYQDILKEQEKNLKNQIQIQLKEQQQKLKAEFEQIKFQTEGEKYKQEQILKQQNQQLQEESDKKLKDQQEQYKKQMQEEIDRQINESKLQYEDQKKQLELQIHTLQQTQIKQIENYKLEYKEYRDQIEEVQKQLIQTEAIQKEYTALKSFFEQIDVNILDLSLDYTKLSENLETIKQQYKQLNEKIQNIKQNIQKEQYEQSSSEQQQKTLDLIKTQFLQSKADLQEEFESQFKQLKDSIQGKDYLESLFQEDCQKMKNQYEQEVKQLNQFNEFQDFAKVQEKIEIVKQKLKQLKVDGQKILDSIKQQELIQIEEKTKETVRLQSLQQQKIEDQQKSLDEVKKLQQKEFQSQKEAIQVLIKDMEQQNTQNQQLQNELQLIGRQFKEQILDTSTEQITNGIEQLKQFNQKCVELKSKIQSEASQIKIWQTELNNEAQLYLSYIEDLRNKISSKNQQLIKDYEKNFIISGEKIIEKYSNKIQELTNQPQPNQSHIQNIQENRKQMQLEYESLSNTLIQEANKENEKLMKQVTEQQESYNQAFQTEKDNVKKRINELEKMSIQSEELKNQLIKIKSQFNQDIVPFEQIGRNSISQQQFTTIFQQLSQLNLQCTDLEYKIKLEVDQLKYTNQANEAKQNQCKELQQKKEGVKKSINEMKTQNQELSQKLNGIKSQFQSNFPQMEQQNYITFTTQQIQEKIDFLNQLNQSCVELKAKIEMEAQQIKKQLEYVKQEFQQELQAQIQKIQDLKNKATSIDPSLQKDIETITQKIQYYQQQINEYYGQDTNEQRITNIRNAKQSNMTEYNSIIERLQASSSMSNQANLYFNQVLSNYRLKLDKVIDTVTLRLSQIKQNLTELQQIKSKTEEINNLIQILNQYKQQYEGQLQKYQQSKQKQFDQTQLEYIQAEYEQVIQEQGQIETESRSSYNLYSQVYQYFGQHFMNVFNASKTQLENEQIKKKEKMNGIIANSLKEKKTIKTKEECKKILDENIEQINNDFQQLREQVDVMLKQNPQEQKSFSDFDKGLREIDKQVGNISEYTQKLKESEQKDLESFEEALKFTPNNQMNYIMNQVKLRAKIKDQELIRKILQMKDQQKENKDIKEEAMKEEAMKVYEGIKERILKSLQK